jgi:hypothetical protein
MLMISREARGETRMGRLEEWMGPRARHLPDDTSERKHRREAICRWPFCARQSRKRLTRRQLALEGRLCLDGVVPALLAPLAAGAGDGSGPIPALAVGAEGEASTLTVPDFSLRDVDSRSQTSGELVSPSDDDGTFTAWDFTHAT